MNSTNRNQPDVKVHHTAGCGLCGRTDRHTHTQAEWRAFIDRSDWRARGGRRG